MENNSLKEFKTWRSFKKHQIVIITAWSSIKPISMTLSIFRISNRYSFLLIYKRTIFIISMMLKISNINNNSINYLRHKCSPRIVNTSWILYNIIVSMFGPYQTPYIDIFDQYMGGDQGIDICFILIKVPRRKIWINFIKIILKISINIP